jgi:hypothetical protein
MPPPRSWPGHGRLLDRHRLALVLGRGRPDRGAVAVNAHRNPDGGYGWGLEPDLAPRCFLAYGSCGTSEPVEDLATLGLVGEDTR